MSRTRKWAFVEQEAKRLSKLGLSVRDIAAQLEVNPSTITRWRQAGKLDRGQTPAHVPTVAVTAPKSPAEWSAAVRSDYQLDATDDQLVTLGEQALATSMDPRVSPQVRMSAAGRFQAVVRQLELGSRGAQARPAVPEAPKPEAERQKPRNPPVQRASGDPRGILSAVTS